MRSVEWTVLLLPAMLLAACSRSEGQGYQAPRNLGESVLSWADVSSTNASYKECVEGPLECSPYYLGRKENWEALPGVAANLYEYVALLDFDYDPEPVAIAPGQPPEWTRLKVRSVLEEYVNLLPEGVWDGIFVHGTCDEKGHCIMMEGGYPMPLWSGTSVVFGRVFCPLVGYDKKSVWIQEVYAVEKDILYDFFGFGYDWNEMREALRKAGKASENRRKACTLQGATPPPPPSEEGGSSLDIIIGPLPDPGQ